MNKIIIRQIIQVIAAASLLSPTTGLTHKLAHQTTNTTDKNSPRDLRTIDWQSPPLSKTLTAGYPDSLGLYAFTGRKPETYTTINQQRCVRANFLAFDIDDTILFNTDQTVAIKLLIDTSHSGELLLAYDKSGEAEAVINISQATKKEGVSVKKIGALTQYSIELPRARFSNRGMGKTDLALATLETMLPASDKHGETQLTLCGLTLDTNNYQNSTLREKKPPNNVTFTLAIHDEDKQPVATRLAIYDHTDRMISIPQDVASLPYYETTRNNFFLRAAFNPHQQWPAKNRHFFYSHGQHQLSLPEGQYTLVATKGPEYRQLKTPFTVSKNTTQRVFSLSRWSDMPSQHWYSGDAHIHLERPSARINNAIITALKAEDLHVSNVLEMGNIGANHFQQYAFGEAGDYHQGSHHIAAGIEAPRTGQRGHVLALNIDEKIPQRDNYFLYHEHLNSYQQQGAATGYAHVGSEEFYASRGLALDVPWALVDFVEIMQNTKLRTTLWYEFLNLGFQLTPAAGSDYPYFDQPGAVRNYVHLPQGFTTQQWFEQLKRGKTFVTNGPTLTVTANNIALGDTLSTDSQAPISISASVALNPDIDQLSTVEIIHCGKVVYSHPINNNPHHFDFQVSLSNPLSGWLALKVTGKQSAMAHSAPIYLSHHKQPSWCKEDFEKNTATMLQRLQALSDHTVNTARELETWDSAALGQQWQQQQPALKARIEATRQQYQQRLEQFQSLRW